MQARGVRMARRFSGRRSAWQFTRLHMCELTNAENRRMIKLKFVMEVETAKFEAIRRTARRR